MNSTVPQKSSEIVSVSVPGEMKVWLDKHPRFNRSRAFQDAVNNYRYPQPKQMSPSLALLCFMGIVGGIVIAMLSGLMFQLINQIFALGLLFLGLALSLGSLLTIMRARRDSRAQKKVVTDESV